MSNALLLVTRIRSWKGTHAIIRRAAQPCRGITTGIGKLSETDSDFDNDRFSCTTDEYENDIIRKGPKKSFATSSVSSDFAPEGRAERQPLENVSNRHEPVRKYFQLVGRASDMVEHEASRILGPMCELSRRKRRRVGLAVSGGVDSMALATLCATAASTAAISDPAAVWVAFIVDHGVRAGSAEEATKVKREVERLGIPAEVLKLEGARDGRRETELRRLRYRALAAACLKHKVKKVLVAHHADDEAETVLLRVVGNYLGDGLAGLEAANGSGDVAIPEHGGIYGVDDSGWSRPTHLAATLRGMEIEGGGGVRISRPLLGFTKQELVRVCQAWNTKWWEDATNRDLTLTNRNIIRWMLRSEANLMPRALRPERLRMLAYATRQRRNRVEKEADEIYRRMSIELDLGIGRVRFWTNESVHERWSTLSRRDVGHVKATLIRRLIRLVRSGPHVSLQQLDQVVDLVFPSASIMSNVSQVTVAGVVVRKEPAKTIHTAGEGEFVVYRNPPPRNQVQSLKLSPSSRTSSPSSSFSSPTTTTIRPWWHWQLWENQYWIRIGPAGSAKDTQSLSDTRFLVKHLYRVDLNPMRKSLSTENRRELDEILHRIPPAERSVLPVLVARTGDDEHGQHGTEHVIAFLSLHWSVPTITTPTTNRTWRPTVAENKPRGGVFKKQREIMYEDQSSPVRFISDRERQDRANPAARGVRAQQEHGSLNQSSSDDADWLWEIRFHSVDFPPASTPLSGVHHRITQRLVPL